MEKNYHPEIDESEILGPEDQKKYQSMNGALQWKILTGRFDITTSIMSMSCFRVKPRVGHLKRLKCIYGSLREYPSGAISVRTDKPDYSDLPDKTYDWLYTTYG